MFRPPFLLLPLLACSDYEFSGSTSNASGEQTTWTDDDAQGGDDDDGGGGAGDSGHTEGTPDTPGDTDTAVPDEPEIPTELLLDGCDGATATLSSELVVMSWDPTTESGTLDAPVSGQYHLYDYAIIESGASQTNESAYVRVTNSVNTDGAPLFTNCGDDWVVVDADNTSSLPTGSRQYVGTFSLVEGENDLTISHYCPLYRDGQCESFHDATSGGTCDSSNVNSVHFTGEGICLILAE